jgi:predicted alpha/beta superfamily hydrolase
MGSLTAFTTRFAFPFSPSPFSLLTFSLLPFSPSPFSPSPFSPSPSSLLPYLGGVLHTIPSVVGPGDAVRDVLVATPPGYESGTRRHPVVYLQDGQNLFDEETSFAGSWSLLETLEEVDVSLPPIIVGIPNLGPERLREYSPFDDVIRGEGEGVGYLRWLTEVVKPTIDREFRTLPEREHTAVGGSSMGGLFAMYALLGGAATFGSAWVMSPAFWYADGAIFRWLARQPAPVGRIYLDIGLKEDAEAVDDARRMRDLLVNRGWKPGSTLEYVEDPEGDHDEASWARRLRDEWRRLVGML